MTLQSKLAAMVVLPVVAGGVLWVSSWLTQRHTNEIYDTALLWSEHALAAKDESLLVTQYVSAGRRAVYDGDEASLALSGELREKLLATSNLSATLAERFDATEAAEERALQAQVRQLIDSVSAAVAQAQGGARAEAQRQYEAAAFTLRDRLLEDLERRVREESEGSLVWRGRALKAAQEQTQLGFFVALAGALILLPAFALIRQLRRNLQQLQHGAKRVAAQDFQTRVEVTSDDELSELAALFNRMARALEARRETDLAMASTNARMRALEESRLELERLVAERTEALARTNEELQQSLVTITEGNARLQTSERMAAIGTMAAGVAHEINNPLGYVMANLSFVSRELRELEKVPPSTQEFTRRSEELVQALEDAVDGTRRITSIVQDLKTLSRMDGDEVAHAVSVHAALDSAANIASGVLKNTATLVKQYGDCPLVLGGSGKLAQVFLNLIVNAAQAMPAGRERNRITLVTHTGPQGEAIIEVVDNGVGIPREVGQRVFDAFFTTRPPGVGTGLGLSICHGIITRLEGHIEFESEQGVGTTFRVTLPSAQMRVAAVA